MVEPSTQPAPVTDRSALRIVLFGMPAAGKSSLLGALAQAAQTQEHLLHGRLADPSQGLSELQHRLYDEEPRRTAEEVVPYTIDFEPFAQDGPAASEHRGAVLIDCDGRVANDLLMRRRTLAEDSPEGTLANEVLAADTLVLVVDASAPPPQLDADFGEFVRFLRLLERSRGERSEVGGLPAFLVLAKCDLLAHPDDAPTKWLERIQEQQRQIQARFTEFLKRQENDEGPLPFGRIDLHLWATSVKRPALAGVAAKPREPYGVAELFRQCLDAAQAFRDRRRRSSRLLVWTVAGAGVLVVGMVSLAAALIGGMGPKERRPGDLENRVESMRATEGQTAAERFRGDLRQLEEKIGILTELKQNPQFAALPAESQAYVGDRLDELQTYVAYLKRIQRERQPADAHSEEELRKIEETLKAKGGEGLALPREDWGQTRAGLLHHDRLEDVKLLRNAVEQIDDWYRQKTTEGQRLWTLADFRPDPAASIQWREWQADVQRYLSSLAKPLFAPSAKLPGASSLELTFQTAYAFDRIQQAAAELESAKKRLIGLRDVTAALGLGSEPAQALLVIPTGFTASAATGRVQELRRTYPDFEKAFPETKLPDAARGDVRQAAATSYKPLLEAGREVVLRHLQEASPGGPETPKTWQSIRPWLADAADLSAWRVLARVLLRLAEPERDDFDPVAELSAFLSRDTFELSPKRLALEVPDGLRLRPDGDLTIVQTSTADRKETRLTFSVGDKQRDAQRGVTTYVLRLKEGATLTYHPGDDLSAELPVRDGEDREMKLSWVRGRSQVYQFEHLVREPRLHPRNQDPLKGPLELGIHLSVPPEQGSIPRVPDLVPIVKLAK